MEEEEERVIMNNNVDDDANKYHYGNESDATIIIALERKHVFVALLIAVLSVIYIKWSNRSTASNDALAYAAKIRLEQQQKQQRKELMIKEEGKKMQQKYISTEILTTKIDDEVDDMDEKTNDTAREDNDNDDDLKNETDHISGSSSTEDNPNKNFTMSDCSSNADDEKSSVTNSNDSSGKNINGVDVDDAERQDVTMFNNDNNQWRCACEGGFLPPGMLSSLGGAEAVFRMGTGQCYHKQT